MILYFSLTFFNMIQYFSLFFVYLIQNFNFTFIYIIQYLFFFIFVYIIQQFSYDRTGCVNKFVSNNHEQNHSILYNEIKKYVSVLHNLTTMVRFGTISLTSAPTPQFRRTCRPLSFMEGKIGRIFSLEVYSDPQDEETVYL